MKTTPVTPADIGASVLAVPPLARNADFSLNRAGNASLIRHLEAGGVRTLMYGGNANFYNVGLYEYASILDMLEETAAAGTWVIPSVGPDFGKMMDQADILRGRKFPTAMALPQTFPMTPAGVETGLKRLADRMGKKIIVYIKAEGFTTPESVKSLVDSGIVAGIKYAIVRKDPKEDAFLSKLVELVDRKLIISGIGERPAIVHLRDFGLNAFTSGSVCIGPRGSMALLAALKRKDYATAEKIRAAYIALEDCRDKLSPIRVLHEAVTLAGIADMGPMLPLLSNLEAEHHDAVRQAARELLTHDRGLVEKAA
jgi:dihydrodipicolinate synthase/N-acetylneuraminate lyase